MAMSFSPAFDRPLPRIEASLRRRSNKERLFRSTAIRSPLWYGEPGAISNAKFYSRSHDAVIRVYDAAGVIETHEHAGEFSSERPFHRSVGFRFLNAE
jgi:hypothetical protein